MFRFLLITLLIAITLPSCLKAASSSVNINLTVNTTSTTSTSTATTTTSNGGGGGSSQPITGTSASAFQLYNLFLLPNVTSATLTWQSTKHSFAKISWGLTYNYELGSVTESAYGMSHSVNIMNLASNETYYVKIEAEDNFGHTQAITGIVIHTTTMPVSLYPDNVINLNTQTPSQNQVILTWQNPYLPNLEAIKVVRSPFAFPTTPEEGKVVYEGPGTTITDTDILPNRTYYYRVYVRNTANYYSSGVGIIADLTLPAIPLNPIIPVLTQPQSTTTSETIAKELNLLFIQNNNPLPVFHNEVSVQTSVPVIVSLDAERVRNQSEEVYLIIENPDQRQKLYYFLKPDPEGNTYQTNFTFPDLTTSYPYTVLVTDENGTTIYKTSGIISASSTAQTVIRSSLTLVQKINDFFFVYFITWVLVVLTMLWWVVWEGLL